MSNRSKGNAFELRVKKILEATGYTVDKARAITRPLYGVVRNGRPVFVSSANDFFGCVDLMGIHPNRTQTLMVQCFASKDAGGLSHRKRKLEAILWSSTGQRVQLWQYLGKPGCVRIHELLRTADGGSSWTFNDHKPGAKIQPLHTLY